jgi:pyruvate dehydrogenase E2 component (dihydrolipoamide acetyltransferase)
MSITKLGMPKFGLVMKEGALVAWLVEEGAEIATGDEIAEVETDKINGAVEAPAAGILRRQVAKIGDVVPVGGLLGVLADATVRDDEIDAYIAEFQATFVPEVGDEEAGPRTEMVTVGDGALRYLRQGEGPQTVVLVHGFGGDLTTWLFNAEALAGPERSVYAFDLPGHGGSSKDVGGGTVAELAATLGAALGALGLERVHLVGHSLGGAVGVTLAATEPERVASLTLVAPTGLGEEIDGEFIDGFVAAESRRELKPLLERLFADPAVVTRQFAEDVAKTKRIDGVDEALRAIAAASFPGGRQTVDLRDELADVRVPVLAIWGTEDRIVPAAHAAALPGSARVETLPGAGHMPQMEAAGEVNRLIDGFLDSVGT